jgi:cytochrome c553
MNSMRFEHARGALLAAISLFLAAPAFAEDGSAERGRLLAYTCMGCHGIENYKNAYPKYSVPKLKGQSAVYIAAALAEYKAGARSHPTMKGFATSLSEQDHADLAAWFQGPERTRSDAKPVGTAPAAAAPCTACHGQNGIGTLPENPTLAGQHADYLAQALYDYRHGKRQNPIMSTFASQLTPDDIQAISAYFAQQQGLATPRL